MYTDTIYAWRAGPGITDRHPSSQRGYAAVNFKDGTAPCDDTSEYFALHGALLLFVWMLIAPYGIYQARCGVILSLLACLPACLMPPDSCCLLRENTERPAIYFFY